MNPSVSNGQDDSGMIVDSGNAADSSSSSDDDDDMELDSGITLRVKELEAKLLDMPYHYETHKDLIEALRNCGELEKLRDARKEMSSKFPLTETLWKDWLTDEEKYAESNEDHEYLASIFEKATQDYLCPDIWLEYAQYSCRLIGSSDGIAKIRAIIERGLGSVGLHASKGAELWDAYREVENAILLTMQPAPGSITSAEQVENINTQISKIGSIFTRQLAIPLIGMEETWNEYLEWRKTNENGEVPISVRKSYEEALKALEKNQQFESDLENAKAPKLTEYLAYIEHEKLSKDPARVQCIYERAICENCLYPPLWEQYIKYLTDVLKSGSILASVSKRATRNCPWSSSLWTSYLSALERNKASFEEMKTILDEALAVGFSSAGEYSLLWQSWCDIVRRKTCECDTNDKETMKNRLRKTFRKATSYLQNKVYSEFNETGDPEYTLWFYWARCEATVLGDIDSARTIIDGLMKNDVNARRKWPLWLEYFDIEKCYGDQSHVRSVLRQAVQSAAADDGGAEIACHYYIRYERENGTLADLDNAQRKVDSRLAKVSKRKENISAQENEKPKKKFDQKDRKKKDKPFQKSSQGMKSNDKKRPSPGNNTSSPQKRAKTSHQQSDNEFKAPTILPVRFVASSSKQSKHDDKPHTVKSSSKLPESSSLNSNADNTSSARSTPKGSEMISTDSKEIVKNISGLLLRHIHGVYYKLKSLTLSRSTLFV